MEDQGRKRVMVAIPSGDQVQADFMMCLLQMCMYSMARTPFDIVVDNFKGSILPLSRETLVNNALQRGATHILFVDSDMGFPAETIDRLMSHEEQVVACNCVTKRIPATPTARLYDPMEPGGEVVYPPISWSPGDAELQEVWRVGTGVMLIDLSVFDALPKPWFPISWEDDLQQYRGEDWNFCAGLQALGVPIYIDIPLSYAIKHQGKLDYDMTLVEQPDAE